MIPVRLADDHRRALRDAAALLKGQAAGLRDSGSANTVAALHLYVATCEALAAAPDEAPVTGEQRTHLEKAQHILEGVRDGLLNADFEGRAEQVEHTVRRLDDLVTQFNTRASQ